MRRKLRKKVRVCVEMSESESINIRIILFHMNDSHIKEIMKLAKHNEKHFGAIKETLQELCCELEIHEGEKA